MKASIDSSMSTVLYGISADLAKSYANLLQPHMVFDINEMIRYIVFRDRNRVTVANKK